MDSITTEQCFQIRGRRKRRCCGHLDLIRRAGTLAVRVQHLDSIKERRIWIRREVGKSVCVSSREILVMTLGWRQFRYGPPAPFKGNQRSTNLGRARMDDAVWLDDASGWNCRRVPGVDDRTRCGPLWAIRQTEGDTAAARAVGKLLSSPSTLGSTVCHRYSRSTNRRPCAPRARRCSGCEAR